MLQFIWPWVFFLLPLPLVVRALSPKTSTTNESALRVPYIADYQISATLSTRLHKRWPLFFYLIIWVLLVIATSRPQWIGEPIELPVSGRDLMLAIDLSNSMSQRFNYGSRSYTKTRSDQSRRR